MILTFVILTAVACFPCSCTDPGCLYSNCVDSQCNVGLLCYNANSTCVEESFRPSGNEECETLNMCLGDPCYSDSDCSPELFCSTCNDAGCLNESCLITPDGLVTCNDGLLCYNSIFTCVDESFRPSGNEECETLNTCVDDPCYSDSDCSPELFCFF